MPCYHCQIESFHGQLKDHKAAIFANALNTQFFFRIGFPIVSIVLDDASFAPAIESPCGAHPSPHQC